MEKVSIISQKDQERVREGDGTTNSYPNSTQRKYLSSARGTGDTHLLPVLSLVVHGEMSIIHQRNQEMERGKGREREFYEWNGLHERTPMWKYL
jgi:hypothetical protein